MALDFPSNPIDGQVYNNYVWSASSGAWRGIPSYQRTTTQSPTAPTSPNPGDIWINTNSGTSFHYYDDGTSQQWVEMFSSAVPAVNTIMPAGTIVQTARATAPDLWLLCDGSAVSRTTYATLFAAIGTQYGSGDGSSTFNIPNLQGRVPVGKNSATFNALGATGGEEAHTLTIAEMPSHTHTQDPHTHGVAYFSPSPVPTGVPDNNWVHPMRTSPYNASGVINNTTATNQNTGGGGSHNNLQPYIVLNYMIKV